MSFLKEKKAIIFKEKMSKHHSQLSQLHDSASSTPSFLYHLNEEFVFEAWEDLALRPASKPSLEDFFRVFYSTNYMTRSARTTEEKKLHEGPWKEARQFNRLYKKRDDLCEECVARLSFLLKKGKRPKLYKIYLSRSISHVKVLIPNVILSGKKVACMVLEFSRDGYLCIAELNENRKESLLSVGIEKTDTYNGDIEHLVKSLQVLRTIGFTPEHYNATTWNCQDFAFILWQAMASASRKETASEKKRFYCGAIRIERNFCSLPPVCVFGSVAQKLRRAKENTGNGIGRRKLELSQLIDEVWGEC
eukprot:GHVP01051573.1.p1 GENE.GHVP01051573.1~~GHVP01051573.1.p1  ORF type:complete len:305 (+),score=50.77 GHVP01051573.1:20-934(+)